MGCNDIVELARMFDATSQVGLGGVGWGGVGCQVFSDRT